MILFSGYFTRHLNYNEGSALADYKTLHDDFYHGLFEAPRSLPAKYFYDEAGSLLFDQICDLPEYYPTRTEERLLEDISFDLISKTRPNRIIELGSGAARKTIHLLDACEKLKVFAEYVPVDVCQEMIEISIEHLSKRYGWLKIQPVLQDYTQGDIKIKDIAGRNLYVFLGGTIGNFSHEESLLFLKNLKNTMGLEDRLLIGVDRVKTPRLLHEAYNDSRGLTAEFNLNLLKVLNKSLDATFSLSNFQHYAYYNPLKNQIEMHLISMVDQTVKFEKLSESISFLQGDSILTEISRKFTRRSIESLLELAGYNIMAHYDFSDPKFSLVLAD